MTKISYKPIAVIISILYFLPHYSKSEETPKQKELSEILQSALNNISVPVQKEFKGHSITTMRTEKDYPNWSEDEIIRFESTTAKQRALNAIPNIKYITQIELFKEAIQDSKTIPSSFSNTERWLEKGLLVRLQTPNDCVAYSAATALDAALINQGVNNPSINAKHIKTNMPKSYSLDTLKVTSKTVPGPNKKFPLKGVTLRNCRGIINSRLCGTGLTEIPPWLRKKMELSRSVHDWEWELLDIGLIKREISLGRPVLITTIYGGPTNFKEDFIYDPKIPNGLLTFHTIVLSGYKPNPKNPTETLFEFINSWGKKWGNGGRAWISGNYIRSWPPELTEAISLELELEP